jgi:hypothetical protein
VCILGFAAFFDVNRRFPSDFYYDDEGVRINFDYDGKGKWVEFPWEELVQIRRQKPLICFTIWNRYSGKNTRRRFSPTEAKKRALGFPRGSPGRSFTCEE